MKRANIAINSADRAEHAANIIQGAEMWKAYGDLHANAYAGIGQQKYQIVNAEGKVLAAGANQEELVANATDLLNNASLRHEDFLTIRSKVEEVRRRSLNGITDLQNAGLSFSVALGDQLVGFEKVNEFQAADQDMNPDHSQNNDTTFTEDYVPNPITHSGFTVPWRQQGFDYKRALGLTESVRQVSERLEDTLFNGNTGVSVTLNGTSIPLYGYTTHPDRGTGTISDWTLTANQGKIVNELIDQIGAMWANQGGVSNDSVCVYVANDIWNVLQKDYDAANPSKAIMDRMKDIAQVKDVKPAEKLASKQVVLVELEARSVELAVASDIITVPHLKTSAMAPQRLTTYAAMVHQIKSDSNSNTGVRHLTI